MDGYHAARRRKRAEGGGRATGMVNSHTPQGSTRRNSTRRMDDRKGHSKSTANKGYGFALMLKLCLTLFLVGSMSYVVLMVEYAFHGDGKSLRRGFHNRRRYGKEQQPQDYIRSSATIPKPPAAPAAAIQAAPPATKKKEEDERKTPTKLKDEASKEEAVFEHLPKVTPLDQKANTDAYGLASTHPCPSSASIESDLPSWFLNFCGSAQSARNEFASRYGGEEQARAMLLRGSTTFSTPPPPPSSSNANDAPIGTVPSDVRHTANRILNAIENPQKQKTFRMAFGGYSVTVGRGNYFHQSFPFVVERLLQPLFTELGLHLRVRNAAIGGIPAFPYGWCLPNFFGREGVDVISWDYSMNEGNQDVGGLEAYVRHAVAGLSGGVDDAMGAPMLIVKDTHKARNRREMLQRYVNEGTLKDPIVIHTDPAVDPFLNILQDKQKQQQDETKLLPLGFQQWRKFGGPPGAPGQAKHHPALKEHELIAWMIAMHMLAAMEVAAVDMLNESASEELSKAKHQKNTLKHPSDPILLPKPTHTITDDSSKDHDGEESSSSSHKQIESSLLFGVPFKTNKIPTTESDDEDTDDLPKIPQQTDPIPWIMNPIHCRTSFDPTQYGTLNSIITSGTSADNIDLMLPKGAMFYNNGWVLDYGEGEKKAKRSLQKYDGLGYIDSKKAYYGTKPSGNLTMFLPYEQHHNHPRDTVKRLNQFPAPMPKDGDQATTWFKSIVICEVNEKRGDDECNIARDFTFVVGGTRSDRVHIIDTSASYLGKKICVAFPIPRGALLTTNTTPTNTDTDATTDQSTVPQIGLSLDVAVHNPNVLVDNGACSVSHVIWEQVTHENN
mmetsp:Transcript_20574/g.30186  ORF Transcript_20574/g.30186 Transcript_20574/m.30186 type:complete len:838 (+) Transcript_20574:124-2637(+)|eukprot:CAMPEP_0195524558 /NCGR_PEP_ID=MMETSP0794_2-20130614/24468_1 /TAXON_ID=515487 /ORGANISM="Stephanopyxis turris, Strain CCMP 815" /LENGTH=837 /DNA_ID=CAMNT_0040654807 /DNA_START=119 /DNA_END=2632 /DNA_ORIENTATION=-